MEEYLVRVLYARYGAVAFEYELLTLAVSAFPSSAMLLKRIHRKGGKGVTLYIQSAGPDEDKVKSPEYEIYIPWLTEVDLIPYRVTSKRSGIRGRIYRGYDILPMPERNIPKPYFPTIPLADYYRQQNYFRLTAPTADWCDTIRKEDLIRR